MFDRNLTNKNEMKITLEMPMWKWYEKKNHAICIRRKRSDNECGFAIASNDFIYTKRNRIIDFELEMNEKKIVCLLRLKWKTILTTTN